MKKVILSIMLALLSSGIASEPAETGSVYFLASGDEAYADDIAARRFLFISKRENCRIASYKNGELDRCMKVDEDGRVYSILNTPSGRIAVSQVEVVLSGNYGVAVFKRSSMSLAEAIRYSGESARALEKRRQAEERSRDEDFAVLVAKNSPSLSKLIVNSERFIDRTLSVHGFCELENYYNYGYIGAGATHYSVSFAETRNSVSSSAVNVYFRKDDFPTLTDHLDFYPKAPKRRCKISMTLRKDRFEQSRFGNHPMFEGLSISYLD